MISELKDEEILEFLMNSDLEDSYSPEELKYLLFKWRYFYRILQGNLSRDKVDLEGRVRELEAEVKSKDDRNTYLMVESANKQNTIDGLKNRTLTWSERWTGKIITKEDEI